jgi:hypothetical protein
MFIACARIRPQIPAARFAAGAPGPPLRGASQLKGNPLQGFTRGSGLFMMLRKRENTLTMELSMTKRDA